MKKDYSCGVIPVRKENNEFLFLLIQHNVGHWSFPKGHIEGSETDTETALRELREETGITSCDIVKDHFFEEKYIFEKEGTLLDKTVKYYIGWVENSDIDVPEREIQSYKWANSKDAYDLLTYPEIKDIFKKVLIEIASR